MIKSDVKYGNVVELRNGDFYVLVNVYNESILIALKGNYHSVLDAYNENLTHTCGFEMLDIVKVYADYTCKELLWERKEKPKLNENEKVILKNVPKHYKWIARDKNGVIYLYSDRPLKSCFWLSCSESAKLVFPHLFQFIKWEDKEPYSIEYLLGE